MKKPHWTAKEDQIIKSMLKDRFGIGKLKDHIKYLLKFLPLRTPGGIGIRVRALLGPFNGKTRQQTSGNLKKYFFNKWSHDMAYIVGFTYADGCLQKYRNRIKWALSIKDEYILRRFRTILGSGAKIGHYNTKLGSINGRALTNNRYPTTCLAITCKEFINSFENMGIPAVRKTFRLKIPNNIPKKYLPDFIRGYFDGDGSVMFREEVDSDGRAIFREEDPKEKRKTIKVQFAGYYRFLIEIRKAIIKELGFVPPKPIKIKGERIYGFSFTGVNAIKFGKWMYNTGSDLFLTRKFKIWTEAFKYPFRTKKEAIMQISLNNKTRGEHVTANNKKQILKMAEKRYYDFNSQVKLKHALFRYVNKKHPLYDHDFDAKIRKLKPDLFINKDKKTLASDQKRELLKVAKSGGSRPKTTTKLGIDLYQLTRNSTSDRYDLIFAARLKNLRPDWFRVGLRVK
jgi:hypothetical protein